MYRVTTLCVSFVTSLSCPVMSPAAPSQAVHIPDSNHTCRVNFACRFLSIWLSSKIKVPHHRHHHNLSTLLLSPFSLWPPPPYQVASTDVMLRLSRKLVSHLNKYSPKRLFCINFIKALIQLLRGTSLDIAKLVPPTWSSPWARIEPSVLGGHHLGVIIKSAISRVKVVKVRGCGFRFWIQNEGRATEIPQTLWRIGGGRRDCVSDSGDERGQDHHQAAAWIFTIPALHYNFNYDSTLATSSW